MKKLLVSVCAVVGGAVLLSGCSFGASDASLNTSKDLNNPNVLDPTLPVDPNLTDANGSIDPPVQPNRCDVGKTYTGFAGTVLEVGRVDADVGVDRNRVKPFSALQTEYARVLGSTPTLLNGAATTFEPNMPRWLSEPQSNAVSLYTAYRIAFQGCLTATGADTKYTTAPTNTTAETECRTWARTFWSRTPTQAEVDMCVQVAMVDTAMEGNTPTTPQRKWAYTCASVLSAAGFLTY